MHNICTYKITFITALIAGF